MPRKALFAGLVVDEFDHPTEIAYVGEEPCYVVNDGGFRRHILAEQVDRQVLEQMHTMIEGNESFLSEQAAKMVGQEDIFTRAMIEQQLKNLDQQFDAIMQTGIPEEGRAYMGMIGFKVVINVHGEVIRLVQPTAPETGSDGE